MFKLRSGTYSKKFTDYLKKLDIKHADTSLHSLRHSFCTNLYYLAVPSKTRQYLMGHKTSRMTQDTYTTYDPTVTRQDVLDIYKDNVKYPNFDNMTSLLLAN